MRLTAAFVRHELLLQRRSLRARFVAMVLVAGSLVPSVSLRLFDPRTPGGSFAVLLQLFAPMLTFLAAAALSLDGIAREHEEGALQVLGLAPVTNAGYVLRRWLAVSVAPLALSLVPVAATWGLMATAPLSAAPPAVVLWPWLLQCVPAALLGSALGLGFGTMAGAPILAMVQAFLLGSVVLSLGNDLLSRTGRVLDAAPAWLHPEIFGAIGYMRDALPDVSDFILGVPPTDAPMDLAATAEVSLSGLTFFVVFAAIALSGAILYLRRSQPDVRPIVVRPDHPLRGFLGWLNRLRPSALPDPGLTRTDAAALVALAAIGVGVGAHACVRFDRYFALGSERYRVEQSGLPEPTSQDLAVLSWAVEGRLAPDGEWRGVFRILLRNDGPAPIGRLACELEPSVGLSGVKIDGHAVEPLRAWDRVEMTWPAPVAPGATVMVEGAVSGIPVARRFPAAGSPFQSYWDPLQSAELASQRLDLSRSTTRRKAGAREVALTAADLAPVPRLSSWKLQRYGRGMRSYLAAPADEAAPAVHVSLDVATPGGFLLADACGGVSRTDDGDAARLRSECATPLREISIRGGRRVALPVPPALAGMLVIEGHEPAAKLHLSALARAAESASGAWPDLSVPPPAIVEQPGAQRRWAQDLVEVPAEGSMLVVSEWRLRDPRELSLPGVTAAAITVALLQQRPAPRDQRLFFTRLYGALVRARLGLGAEDAVFGDTEAQPAFRYSMSLLEASSWESMAWEDRLPALVRTLRLMTGDDRLADAVNAHVAREGTGSARELFETIEARTGAPAMRFYEDFIEGGAVPVLTLESVTFERDGAAWTIGGLVRNQGTGHVRCPVQVRTDGATSDTVVDVGSEEAVPFQVTSDSRPRFVLLDPKGDCFRWRPKNGVGITERVEHAGTK